VRLGIKVPSVNMYAETEDEMESLEKLGESTVGWKEW
jgi:hypothetical protein